MRKLGYKKIFHKYTDKLVIYFIFQRATAPKIKNMSPYASGILSLHSVSYYIAGCVNYSASHFGQIFLKKTGHSPLNYFNQLKIQKACKMLDFSDMKIKEIANELGFYDQYHFSKTFFKITGETPTQYKKRNKG